MNTVFVRELIAAALSLMLGSGAGGSTTATAPEATMIGQAVAGAPAPEPAPMPPGSITFVADTNSVLDPDASLSVIMPEADQIATLHTDGNSEYYLWFNAAHPGFALGALTRGGAPCDPNAYMDSGKGDGQRLYIIIDGGPARVLSIDDSIKIPVQHHADAGPHTLRAVMSRSWDESLKGSAISSARETDLYCCRTFYIDTNTGTHEVDSTLPLLTLNAPLETYNHGGYPSDQVMMDFYLMFKGLAQGYSVEATLMDSCQTVLAKDTLHQWVPYCITGIPDPPTQAKVRYILRARLLNAQGTPVQNGARYNLNDITREFYVRKK